MNRITAILILTLFLSACAVHQQYDLKSNLNNISIGQTKQQLLQLFSGEKKRGGAPPMQIRAAQKNDGKLVEVGEVLMTDGVSPTVAYWFLFEDGKLIQWGQPADWKEVGARYEIGFDPSIGVTE